MKDYKIFCDSACDMPKELLQKHNITLIPFYISFDQQTYVKEIEEMTIPAFYGRLTSEKVFPKTSLPSVQDYIDRFKPVLKEGNDILCICLNSRFSGSYQSAVNAKLILEEDFPDAEIIIINSIQATACQGLIGLQAAYMKGAGYTLQENASALASIKRTARIMFTVGSLEYLQKGGRIGKVSSLAGTMLNLKPLIQLKDEELIPYGTIRGRNKSLEKILMMVRDFFEENNENYDDYDFVITTGTSFVEAEKVKSSLESLIGRSIPYPVFTIGVTIGTNTGPDAIGICFVKKHDSIWSAL